MRSGDDQNAVVSEETSAQPDAGELDPARVAAWLGRSVDTAVCAVSISRMAGGHSSGAWRLDVQVGAQVRPMVLKAPGATSLVFRRDACREARILHALHGLGAPVPAVIAMDCGSTVTGRPCFAMELVEARAVDDSPMTGCHGEGWLRDAGPRAQRAVWESFHDALAALHRVDASKVADARLGRRGVVDFLDYWRDAVLDVAPAEAVPRHLAVLDWLRDNVPPDAEDSPAVCMGDSRLANALIVGTETRALVDFEVAYVGNPAADIGYSLAFDAMHRQGVDQALPGFPPAEETWQRWAAATGRDLGHRDYWRAFGATVLCVTGVRAMVQWGAAPDTVENGNGVLADWEAAAARAAR
jgi:aminoglycoside phosphotransferase (APT) family kinase protein